MIDLECYGAKESEIVSMRKLVEALIKYVKDPRTMYSDESGLGLYWDSPVHYADIELSFDMEQFSLYARDRSTQEEKWIESFRVEDVTEQWVKDNLLAFLK